MASMTNGQMHEQRRGAAKGARGSDWEARPQTWVVRGDRVTDPLGQLDGLISSGPSCST